MESFKTKDKRADSSLRNFTVLRKWDRVWHNVRKHSWNGNLQSELQSPTSCWVAWDWQHCGSLLSRIVLKLVNSLTGPLLNTYSMFFSTVPHCGQSHSSSMESASSPEKREKSPWMHQILNRDASDTRSRPWKGWVNHEAITPLRHRPRFLTNVWTCQHASCKPCSLDSFSRHLY